MQPHIVAQMSQVCPPWRHFANQSNSLVKRLMRYMLPPLQSTHHQHIKPLQLLQFAIRYSLHISQIGKPTNPIPQYRQPMVIHPYRHNLNTLYLKRIAINLLQIQFRNTPISTICKTVRNTMPQSITHIPLHIQIYIPKAFKRAHIVQPTHMIIMLMRNQHPINFLKRHPQHLLPKIGSCIYQNPLSPSLNHY